LRTRNVSSSSNDLDHLASNVMNPGARGSSPASPWLSQGRRNATARPRQLLLGPVSKALGTRAGTEDGFSVAKLDLLRPRRSTAGGSSRRPCSRPATTIRSRSRCACSNPTSVPHRGSRAPRAGHIARRDRSDLLPNPLSAPKTQAAARSADRTSRRRATSDHDPPSPASRETRSRSRTDRPAACSASPPGPPGDDASCSRYTIVRAELASAT